MTESFPNEVDTDLVSIDRSVEPPVVRFGGDLDAASCGLLQEALNAAGSEGWPVVTFDASGISFVDSAGLNVLIHAHRTAEDRGARFVIRAPSPSLRRLLEIAALDRFLTLED